MSVLQPGRNCWRIERAGRASLIVDAADYYRLARQAMLKAKHQILLIGWDFDTRIFLDPKDGDTKAPHKLGALILWLAQARPDLQIYILKWDIGAIKLLWRGSTAFTIGRWALHDRIHFKLDGAHPHGASHHQKILVIDDALAFCGGIDMTGARWDTRRHQDKDPRRKHPTTRRDYGPWHDATMAVDGAAARVLGELGRARWQAASGVCLRAPPVGSDIWPEELRPMLCDADIAIARTRGAHRDQREIREIEALCCDLIASAQHFVYAETQYFASRVIAEAIARRLEQPHGPEFVLVNPRSASGWLEEEVMGPARAELMRALAPVDHHGRFRIYTPITSGGADIYVHAKIMVVDDQVLRVGSANMNNRSLGLDSECDLVIDAGLPSNRAASAAIAKVRSQLMAEHLGVPEAAVATCFGETGSLVATVERLRGTGRTLVPFTPPEPNALEAKLAKSELLDPEGTEDSFEPIARPGLLAWLRRTRPA